MKKYILLTVLLSLTGRVAHSMETNKINPQLPKDMLNEIGKSLIDKNNIVQTINNIKSFCVINKSAATTLKTNLIKKIQEQFPNLIIAAVKSNKLNIVKFCINTLNADTSAIDPTTGKNALIIATINNNLSIINLLLTLENQQELRIHEDNTGKSAYDYCDLTNQQLERKLNPVRRKLVFNFL